MLCALRPHFTVILALAVDMASALLGSVALTISPQGAPRVPNRPAPREKLVDLGATTRLQAQYPGARAHQGIVLLSKFPRRWWFCGVRKTMPNGAYGAACAANEARPDRRIELQICRPLISV